MTTNADQEIVLDRFQIEAAAHTDADRSVLVAAPTGSGKTLVAEHAIERALRSGSRAYYTAPIKALSNQKFHDFSDRWGSGRVGLVTGDNVINPDADLVVMTTEVLRNMLYAHRVPADLAVVVLDEVHYIEDSFRGPVWEEVILNLPPSVTLVCLSATVSNTDELGGWIESVRGPTGVVVETDRPVELTNLYAIGDRRDRLHVIPIHVGDRPNPEGHKFDADQRRRSPRRHRPRQPWRTPGRADLLDYLVDRDLLPAIWFVFSRNGCDEAASALARSDVRLTDAGEAARIRVIVEERLARLDPADLDVLDAARWAATLERGIAAHHAGLVPAFKEAVEQCFVEGLVRIVFATETLAVGVNLPARSVVIDRLTKFTGETHEPLTPGQFTQLTGRAGRRGLDDRGHAVIPWSPFTSFAQVSALAGSRRFRLRSAFRPTYNMAANLLVRLDPDEARGLLGRSFAQYQADADVARLEQRLARERERLARLRREIEAHPPDDDEPRSPVDADAVSDAVSRLRPGDVVVDETGERLLVLGVSWRRRGRARVRLLDVGGRDIRWELAELSHPPTPLTRIDLPTPMAPEQSWFREEAAGALRRTPAPDRARRRSDRTRSGNDGRDRLRRVALEVKTLEKRARRDETSIARRFDAVVGVMRDRGHIDGWIVTDSGRLIGRIYHDIDLVVAEALERGFLDNLDPATLAGVVSVFTHEHRSASPPPPVWFPSRTGRRRFEGIERMAKELRRIERRHGVPESRPPDAGFATVAHRWADGEDLSALLDDELSAGDFVRNVKQLIDLLRQISSVAPVASTRSTARSAADALHRGVVAISGAQVA